MAECIDYYFSLNSPWSYMGHERFQVLTKHHGIAVRPHPVDYAGVIFPATGGLPVGKRSPQRQAYRLAELERWRRYLDITLNIHPKFWPADEVLAAQLVLAVRESGAETLTLIGALMRAVWALEHNIADRDTLLSLLAECGLDGEKWVAAAQAGEMKELRAKESHDAIEHGVFGAPTYIYRERIFWGQDRLDLLAHAIEDDG
jgi:2-hydroxychromene-2-carboxylate isomerase